jgi:hypothetical protein
MSIEIYRDYTVRELRDQLVGATEIGDADELHSALIVLCDIVKAQVARIAKLEKKVSDLENLETDKRSTDHEEYREKRARWAALVEANRRESEGR